MDAPEHVVKEEELEEKESEAPPQAAAPPPVPVPTGTSEEDVYNYAMGYVVQEYSGQPTYARYVRPKPTCDDAGVRPAESAHERNRSGRVAPQAFTHGAYRSRRGNDSRFNNR